MKSFLQFISETTATQQAARLGLVSDGHGGWKDRTTGEFVAKTEKGTLKFYNKRQKVGGKDPAQSEQEKNYSSPDTQVPPEGQQSQPVDQQELPPEEQQAPQQEVQSDLEGSGNTERKCIAASCVHSRAGSRATLLYTCEFIQRRSLSRVHCVTMRPPLRATSRDTSKQ